MNEIKKLAGLPRGAQIALAIPKDMAAPQGGNLTEQAQGIVNAVEGETDIQKARDILKATRDQKVVVTDNGIYINMDLAGQPGSRESVASAMELVTRLSASSAFWKNVDGILKSKGFPQGVDPMGFAAKSKRAV